MQNKHQQTTQESAATRYVLAIDLGGGGPKAAIISDTGKIMASAFEKVATHVLPKGGVEQDAEKWWISTKKAAGKVVLKAGIPPENIVAVCCDSQWSLIVPVDKHGEPLMNALHWLDTRGGPYNRAITRGFPSIQGYGMFKLLKWIKQTGLVPTHSGVDSLGHILFIKNERPEVYQKTFKFLEPMDYLTFRLTGKITASQETMLPAMVVSNRKWGTLDYNDQLLKLADLEKDKFPNLQPSGSLVGPLLPSVAEELGLSPSTVVMGGINDTNASTIGSGAIQNFEGIIYIGTSLLLTCHVPFKKTDLSSYMTSIPSPIESRYLLMGEQGTGGKNLEFYLNNIIYAEDEFNTGPMPEDIYNRVNQTASRVPAGSEGVLYLPWLNGTIVPDENPNVRAGFLNLSLTSTRSHMIRAIMEGIAYNNRWTFGPAEKFTGQKFHSLRFSGGGALSDLWAQIHADVLDVPIHQVADPTHTTLRGTAFVAFNKLGYRSLEELSDLVKIKHVYKPIKSNRSTYDKIYNQFREIYKRNKKVFNALNG